MTPHDQLVQLCEPLDRRYAEIEQSLASLAGTADAKTYQQLSKELQSLKDVVLTYRTYRRIGGEIAEADHMVHAHGDVELREMAREEAVSLRLQQADLAKQLHELLAERDAATNPLTNRPIIVEIRAGTGGQEASLFVGDLYRMYSKYAARIGLTVEPMETHPTESGGFKALSFAVKGPGAYNTFKFESGVHRVQRVPETEAQGRIHTSTVTVVVMPEPEEVELPPIPAKDLQIDVYRSKGAGGQSVNTTDSAVRIRHLPTGVVVQCQDERSQLRNKEKAMRVLRARVLDQMQQSHQEQMAATRQSQVKSAERSEKIRTYNFPDRRVTDHRVGVTLHKLDQVMEGALDELMQALQAADRAAAAEP